MIQKGIVTNIQGVYVKLKKKLQNRLRYILKYLEVSITIEGAQIDFSSLTSGMCSETSLNIFDE